MKDFVRRVLGNRHAVLLTTIAAYLVVVVVEGALTGREARILDFENPFFDLHISDFEAFQMEIGTEEQNVL